MGPDAMEPFGNALLAHLDQETSAVMIVRRDDGLEAFLPAAHFFRNESEFSVIEKRALALCSGRVLDIGAGTGIHTLALQDKGHSVTAIDVCPQAVQVMSRRGVMDARNADVFGFREGAFDTLLLLGHGIGMAETLEGLDRLLAHAHTLLTMHGQLLLDSLDVRSSDNPANLAYHDSNRKAGRYIGEIRMQFEFRGMNGAFCGWLQVDPETLAVHAARNGWDCEVTECEKTGDYLARLTRY